MSYALSTTMNASFDEAVERTRHALAEQGFGVLTEIDMKATLKAKLGEDIEDYLILGACNPRWRTAPSRQTARSGCFCPATSSCAPIRRSMER